MYDELVKRLRHSANFAERGLTPPPSELREAADAIEELQQIAAHYEETAKDYFKDACYYRERVPRWIPATGLPSKKNRYLTVSIEPLFGTTVVDTMRWSGVWMHDGRQTEATVTHWMPLPEPPKEEK